MTGKSKMEYFLLAIEGSKPLDKLNHHLQLQQLHQQWRKGNCQLLLLWFAVHISHHYTLVVDPTSDHGCTTVPKVQ